MTKMSDDDRQLRELFVALHQEDRVPPFAKLWRGAATGRRLTLRLVSAGVVALLALLTGSILYRSWTGGERVELSPSEEMSLASGLSGWHAPLDFLLETPGREYYESTLDLELSLPTGPSLPVEPEEVLQ